MAGSVRCFMKLNLGLLSKNVTRHVAFNQIRTLLSKQTLGLPAYLSTRKHYKNQFLNLEDEFRDKMETYVANEATGMIFTEDLKVMLHLIENTPQDTELIMKMLKKFNSQNGDLRFGTYTFGPIVMRALYTLNDYQRALELFNNPEFSMFFNQLTSYQLLLDMLYENKQYAAMRQVYNVVQQRLPEGQVHPRNALILVTAGCYRENTPESLKYALDLWCELNRRGYPVVRRVLIHLSALALAQGQAHVALEILTGARKPRYIGIRCLKIMAFAQIDRLYDIVPFFRHSLQTDDPSLRKETYFKDTIEAVEAAIKKAGLGPDAEIVKLLELIKTGNLVQPDTLDDHINTEIEMKPAYEMREAGGQNRQYGQRSEGATRFVRRPGLRDLV